MGDVIVIQFITLDGVVSDPDGRWGTDHGGWAFRYGLGPVSDDKFRLGAADGRRRPALRAAHLGALRAALAGRDGDFAAPDERRAQARRHPHRHRRERLVELGGDRRRPAGLGRRTSAPDATSSSSAASAWCTRSPPPTWSTSTG